MTQLRWTNERIDFTDHAQGFVTDGPGVYDIDDEEADRYLSHRSGGWERVEESDEAETPGDTTDESEGESDGYSRGELEAMEWSELRTLAVEADRDDINGRSSKGEIIEALADG